MEVHESKQIPIHPSPIHPTSHASPFHTHTHLFLEIFMTCRQGRLAQTPEVNPDLLALINPARQPYMQCTLNSNLPSDILYIFFQWGVPNKCAWDYLMESGKNLTQSTTEKDVEIDTALCKFRSSSYVALTNCDTGTKWCYLNANKGPCTEFHLLYVSDKKKFV